MWNCKTFYTTVVKPWFFSERTNLFLTKPRQFDNALKLNLVVSLKFESVWNEKQKQMTNPNIFMYLSLLFVKKRLSLHENSKDNKIKLFYNQNFMLPIPIKHSYYSQIIKKLLLRPKPLIKYIKFLETLIISITFKYNQIIESRKLFNLYNSSLTRVKAHIPVFVFFSNYCRFRWINIYVILRMALPQ